MGTSNKGTKLTPPVVVISYTVAGGNPGYVFM
jgi:hypothetical protein